MRSFLLALILLLSLEGGLFAAFPELARKCLEEAGQLSPDILRKIGVSFLLLALTLGLLLRHFS